MPIRLALQRLDLLLVGLGAEGGGDEGLRLAAREERRAVRARQVAGLDADRPDLVRLAAVEADALFDDHASQLGRLGGLERCSLVGLTTNWPSTWPTRTAPTGPSNGMPERQSAAEAPFTASTSGSFSWSPEMTRQMTCTSFAKPAGKSGRIGRSISRDVRVSFLTGAPSRLKYPPGLGPPA